MNQLCMIYYRLKHISLIKIINHSQIALVNRFLSVIDFRLTFVLASLNLHDN